MDEKPKTYEQLTDRVIATLKELKAALRELEVTLADIETTKRRLIDHTDAAGS